jgi:hypothetical protein
MARRKPTRPTGRSTRGVTSQAPTPNNPWPNLQALIDDDGQISIGRIGPIACAAVANDDHTCYAMLVRRNGESLVDLTTRLDLAVATAIATDLCVDEINPH